MRNKAKVHELEFLPSILDLIRLDCFINRGKFSVLISQNKPKSGVVYWRGGAGGWRRELGRGHKCLSW